MRQALTILIILGALLLFKRLYSKYESIKQQDSRSEQNSVRGPAADSSAALQGLPPSLEAPLQAAHKQGAEGLRKFLGQYRYAIRDPRLAAIELDYVVLMGLHDPVEARRVFKDVQERTPNFSPVYERVKRLEKTYQ